MMEDSRLSLKEILRREAQHLSDRGLANASKWCVRMIVDGKNDVVFLLKSACPGDLQHTALSDT